MGAQKVGPDFSGERAKVYFTRHVDAGHLKQLYTLVNQRITGRIAVKLHTGEKNGLNIPPHDMVQALLSIIPSSTIVEMNTLYPGDRDTTEKHLETLKVNGWTFCPVDILDAEGVVGVPIQDGRHFKAVSMAKNIVNYDSMLVLTHFKGHAMGGSMKNIAIGYADGKIGKQQVHGVSGVNLPWDRWSGKEERMENMADSAKAVIDHFGEKSPSSTLCAACRSTVSARGAPPPSRRSPTSGCSPRPACLRLIRPASILSARSAPTRTEISSNASNRVTIFVNSPTCTNSTWDRPL